MRRLRSASIGSMSAWLPSRRSTLHHCGVAVVTRPGQVRSGRSIGGEGRGGGALGGARKGGVFSPGGADRGAQAPPPGPGGPPPPPGGEKRREGKRAPP